MATYLPGLAVYPSVRSKPMRLFMMTWKPGLPSLTSKMRYAPPLHGLLLFRFRQHLFVIYQVVSVLNEAAIDLPKNNKRTLLRKGIMQKVSFPCVSCLGVLDVSPTSSILVPFHPWAIRFAGKVRSLLHSSCSKTTCVTTARS